MKRVLHKSVKLRPQATDYLCWEACARMVYFWKNGSGDQTKAQYEKLVKPFKDLQRGLKRKEMGSLYCVSLGMKLHPNAAQAIGGSPLIWTNSSKVAGHAMLIIGFDDQKGFINYDPGSTISMEEGASITAKSAVATSGKSKLDGKLSYVSERRFEADSDGGVWGYA